MVFRSVDTSVEYGALEADIGTKVRLFLNRLSGLIPITLTRLPNEERTIPGANSNADDVSLQYTVWYIDSRVSPSRRCQRITVQPDKLWSWNHVHPLLTHARQVLRLSQFTLIFPNIPARLSKKRYPSCAPDFSKMDETKPNISNPYQNILPGEEGREIQYLDEECEEQVSQSGLTRRSRSSTAALLPAAYSCVTTNPPDFHHDTADYTISQLHHSLFYISLLQNTTMTPRKATFLHLWKEACKRALQLDPPSDITKEAVQAYHRAYWNPAFLDSDRTTEAIKILRGKMVTLGYLELLGNYKDFLGHDLPEIKRRLRVITSYSPVDPQSMRLAQQRCPPKPWSIIASQLKATDFENMVGQGDCANALGVEYKHMQWLMDRFVAEPHSHFCCEVRHFISLRDWRSLKLQISRDSTQLYNLVADQKEREHFQVVLETILYEFFQVSLENLNGWWCNGRAKHLSLDREVAERERGVSDEADDDFSLRWQKARERNKFTKASPAALE